MGTRALLIIVLMLRVRLFHLQPHVGGTECPAAAGFEAMFGRSMLLVRKSSVLGEWGASRAETRGKFLPRPRLATAVLVWQGLLGGAV